FSPKLSANVTAMYINENTDNRPRLSDSPGNANYTAWSLPATINVENLQGTSGKSGANPDGTELQFNDNVFVTNPYWATFQFDNDTRKDRLTGRVQLQYDIIEGLFARTRVSLDRFTFRRRDLTPYGTAYSPFGQLRESNREVQELNTELLFGYNRDITDDITISILAGGNQQRNFSETISAGGGNFNVPFLHSVGNLANQSFGYGFSEFQVNSLYDSAEIGLMRAIYLSGSYRNDWFSTLTSPDGSGENNQGYYSVGVSAVLSDLITMPKNIDFLKLRGSYATGSGPGVAANPYQLNLTYGIRGQGHLGNPLGAISNGSIPNALLTPLLTKEVELGFDMRLFGGRAGVDFTFYDRTTENDIIRAAVSATSGFGSKIVNLGEMTNTGVELLLSGTPIKTQDFSWDVTFNYAYNDNKVVRLLTPEEDGESLRDGESRTRSAYIDHVEGLPYSQVAGFLYARDGNGDILLDANGLPQQGEYTRFGTGVAPTTMGFGSTFRYKNLSLNFLIDMRMGGVIYSATNAFAYTRGLHQNTLVGRESGIGIIESGDVEDYYQRIAGITEQFVYDSDFGKLRQVVLNYTLPQNIVDQLPFTGVTVGVAARNLAILWSKTENIDPESTYNVSNGQGLEMFGVPSTRTVQFNLAVKF
ncbi:MAG: TonB-dependent receptor, partial [Saprospiraceae bacterium]|nr:TonB-dependent receptor [Saprospiraceae bacterium]